MEPIEIISRAADLIEQKGLAKGTYQDRAGSYCLRGALMAAVGMTREEMYSFEIGSPRRHAASQAANIVRWYKFKEYEDHSGLLVAWNDDPRTTKYDVVQLLRKVAESYAPKLDYPIVTVSTVKELAGAGV